MLNMYDFVVVKFAFGLYNWDRNFSRGHMDEKLIEKEIKANKLYDGRVINLRVDDVLLPDGRPAKREYVQHRGGAAILAMDDEGMVYMVRQFRYPYRETLLEIPAGKLEAGEEPIVTATRELAEETGLIAERLAPYGVIYPSPGYTDEKLYIFFASGLRQREAHPDADEFLNVVRMPFEQALQGVLTGDIKDSKTCYAILKYAHLRRGK